MSPIGVFGMSAVADTSHRCTRPIVSRDTPDLACHCTQDGDVTDSSSWTCSSGEVCEITYDLQATESLEQLRIGEPRQTRVLPAR